ncbi:hypothetical protein GCM10028808_29070 [Spirosoma migulaei]
MVRFLLAFFSLLSISNGYAQSIYINPGRSNCPGALVSADFGANGVKFASDNQFVIKLESTNGIVSRELSATAVSDFGLQLRYPDDIPPGEYRMTLRSSNPALTSPLSQPFLIAPRPTASIRAVQKDVVGPFEPIPIEYTYSGPADAKITLNDGTIIPLSWLNYVPPKTTRNYLVRAAQSTTYTIASVTTEVCGNGIGSGAAAVRVSPVGLRLLSVLPAQVCAGSQFNIAYSTSGSFETGNHFTIQVRTYQDSLAAQFPAEATPNGLTAVMPESIPPSDYYYLTVIADKPNVVSRLNGFVVVRRKPAIQLTNSTINIMWGATAELPMVATGKDPIAITLSDGTVLDQQQWDYLYNPNEVIENRFSHTVSPMQTTTYRVQSFSTGCGSGPATGAVTVQVGPGLKISSPDNLTACAGTEWQVPVTIGGTIPATNRLSVRIAYGQQEWPYRLDTLLVPASLSAGVLRLVIPTIISGQTKFRIEGTDLLSPSDWNTLSVQTAPRLTTFQIDESNSQKSLRLVFSGTIPVTFRLNDGRTDIAMPPASAFGYILPLKGYPTSTFSVLSMSNVCGIGVVSQQPIQYDNPNPLRIRLSDSNPKSGCVGTSASIAFDVTGTSTTATVYSVELGTFDYMTSRFVVQQTIGSGSQSPIQITLGKDALPETFIRIVTTDPLAVSEPERFSVQKPAVASYYPNGRTVPLLYEQIEYPMNLGVSGGQPFDITFTNGRDFRKIFHYENNNLPNIEISVPGNYYLESVQNGCGAGTIRSTDTLFVRPFSITTNLKDLGVLCAGSLLNVPFTTKGNAPADAAFSVQISRRRTGGFYDIPSLPSPYPGELLVRLPDTLQHSNIRLGGSSMPNNSYYIRVVSKNKDVVGGVAPVQVYMRRTVAVTLSAAGETVYDPAQGAVQLRIGAKGSAPFFAYIDNRSYASEGDSEVDQQFSNDNDSDETVRSIGVTPQHKTTYSLRTAFNQCGYGTSAGQVTVTVKAKINLRIVNTYTTGICPGNLLSLTAVSSGDFDSGNQLRILLSTSSEAVLKSDDRELARFDSITGPLQVRLPADLLAGTPYYIKVISTRPDNVFSNVESIRIVQPAVASLQGNTIINSGEVTYIRLNLSGGGPYQYELSTGQTGNSTEEGDINIVVQPSQSTTFTLKSVQNACGSGQVSGSAIVDVLPLSSVTLSLAGFFLTSICAGEKVRVPLTIRGSSGGSQTYRVQLSDPLGLSFQDIPTVGEASSLTATIPLNTPSGNTYRLRVRLLETNVVSSASPFPIAVRSPAGATLSGPPYFESGKPVSLTINLTGSAPWSIRLADSLQTVYLATSRSPLIHNVFPNRFTTYRLVSVSNSCGIGTLGTPASVQVGLLTALSQPANEPVIQLMPNPVASVLNIRYDQSIQMRTVQVITMQGVVVMRVAGPPQATGNLELTTQSWPAGVYLIRCETDKGVWESRIVKQ